VARGLCEGNPFPPICLYLTRNLATKHVRDLARFPPFSRHLHVLIVLPLLEFALFPIFG
jgi:hypothetical protein